MRYWASHHFTDSRKHKKSLFEMAEEKMVVAADGEPVLPASRPPTAHRRRGPHVSGTVRSHGPHGGLHPPRAAAGACLRRAAVVARVVPPRLGGALARAPPQRQHLQLALRRPALHLRHRALRPGAAAARLAAGPVRLHHRAVHRAAHAPARVCLPPPGYQPVLAGGTLRLLPGVILPRTRAALRRRRGVPRVPAVPGEPYRRASRVPGLGVLDVLLPAAAAVPGDGAAAQDLGAGGGRVA